MTAKTADVAILEWDDDILGAIKTYEDLQQFFVAQGIEVVDSRDYGHGFSVVKKETLCGVPFIIVKAEFFDGKWGKAVSIFALTKHNEKVIFVDGSTGILRQVKGLIARRENAGAVNPSSGIAVVGGLVRSDYEYADKETGEMTPASTFYLAE